MTQHSPQEVLEAQRQDWNRVAAGWEKWDEFFDRAMTFLNHRLVGDVRVRQGQRVLDLGSGTGYPALLAAQAVGPQGAVIGMDLAEQMLAAAERKARRLGLSNVAFRTGDVTNLPFDVGSFDAVTSRFCLMFLPELHKAVMEILRVLKPGSWMAAAVWSAPDKNPYLKIPIDVIKQFIEVPPPDPSAPGIFRLAKPGDLASLLQQAGYEEVQEQEVVGDVPFSTADEYVVSVMDIAAPIQNLFAQLSAEKQRQAKARIAETANRFRRADLIALPIAVRVVAGRKPIT
jgi:ubiquinone/menaquinone biosynthesis C-methylase UbiE